MPDTEPISRLGRINHHRDRRSFGIRQADRLAHLYVIGRTGVGKSTLLEALARQDAGQGRGFALIDPHGDLVDRLHDSLPRAARKRTTYLDATDPQQPYGYNPLRRVRPDKIPLAAAGLLETLRKLWPTAWGVRMEHVLRNSLYALMERDGSTLPDILRLYSDKTFRAAVTARVRNPVVYSFWNREFKNYHSRLQSEAVAPIQNKLGALLADPMLRRILVAPEVDLRFRRMMDAGEILLVNLSRGHLGEDGATVLGSVLVSTLGLAAFSRSEEAAERRRPFFLYVDEFQNFTTLSFATMLSELRKFGVGVTLAHQYLDQLEPQVRSAVLGNAGTLIAFRVAAADALSLAIEFHPKFAAEDLINLPNRSFYIRLLIDGAPSVPFSANLVERGAPSHRPSSIGPPAVPPSRVGSATPPPIRPFW
jgi:DNA helicase HerA-like ATPase